VTVGDVDIAAAGGGAAAETADSGEIPVRGEGETEWND